MRNTLPKRKNNESTVLLNTELFHGKFRSIIRIIVLFIVQLNGELSNGMNLYN